MSTTIYQARKILTMNPARPLATHVAVRENACFAPEMAVSAEPVSPVEAPTVKE